MKMANPAQPIGVQGVSHLPEFQRLLFGVGREKLSAANHTLQLEMQEYDPKNVTPNLSGLNSWLDNTLSDFDAVNDFHEYMQILHTLVPLANTSRVIRKKIAQWILVAFQKNQYTNFFPHPNKCFALFCFAVAIRHENLCVKMIHENNELSSTFYFEMLDDTAPFKRMTYNVFRLLYERFTNNNRLSHMLYHTLLCRMARLEDSNESRQKVRLWMRVMENVMQPPSESWVSDGYIFTGSNVCMDLVRAGVKNACIFETLYSTYSDLGVDMRHLMNAQLESSWGGSPYNSACMAWVRSLVESTVRADTKLTMFVLRMTDLNVMSSGTTGEETLTFIHYLIIYHDSVEKSADYRSILQFLESGDAQFDKSIQCSVSRGVVDPLTGDHDTFMHLTAFELAHRKYTAERQNPPQHRPPCAFLLGLLAWLRPLGV
jgi:hypothetical protein